MSEHDPLDDRIRDLVARAAAEAPPAPHIDGGTPMIRTNDPHDRRRWLLGGATGLGIAAAVVALFFFARSDDTAEPPLVPATEPGTTTPGSTLTTAPTETTDVTTSEATTPATTTPSDATTPATQPTTTAITTTTTSVPPARPTPVELVVAGPDGVRRGGEVLTEQPMARALPLADGRTLMQRVVNQSDAVADSALLVVGPGSSDPVPLAVPPELDGVVVRLHDAAVVAGEQIVIVETGPGLCANPEACIGAIWAFGPDSGRLDRLQEKIVWEGGWNRLSLASTGAVFGAETESVTRTLRTWIVPGSGADVVDVGALGLEPSYGDCTDCPTGFTIDQSGTFVGWVETDLSTFRTTLVIAAADGGVPQRIPLTDDGTVCCLDDVGADLPFIPVVELAVSVRDGAVVGDAVVNDDGVLNGSDPRPALVVDLETGEVATADGFHVYG